MKSKLRDLYIATGAIRPQTTKDFTATFGVSVLPMDERGKRIAERHIEQGKRGGELMAMPSGLPPWHIVAIARREEKARKCSAST